MSRHLAARWFTQVAPRATVAARNGSVLGVRSAARCGVGVAALPTVLGDPEPGLVRVLGPIPELARAWRLLTPPEPRHAPRVAALFAYVAGEVATLRPILTG